MKARFNPMRCSAAALLALLAAAARLHGEGSPETLASYHFPAGSMGPLAVHNGHAYVMNGWTRGDGLLVFDARSLESPRFVKGIAANGYLADWARAGDTLYIATGFSLMVVDASQPASSRVVRNVQLGFPGMDADRVTVSGDILVMGGRAGGLRLFDITDPLCPVPAAQLTEFGHVSGVAADGRLVAIQARGKPTVLATLEGFKLNVHAEIKTRGTVRLQDGVLFDTDRRGTWLYDVRAPAAPAAVTNLAGVWPVDRLAARRMLARGADGALLRIDLSDPGRPVFQKGAVLPADATPGAAAVADGRLCLLDAGRFSLRVFDISGPKTVETGERWLMRNEGVVELDGSHAWHAYTQNQYLKILGLPLDKPGMTDFTSYVSLTLSNSLGVADVYRACAIKRIGKYLLAGDGLLDISSPAAPRVVHPPTSPAADIAVAGGQAFLAQGDRLTILDVSRLPEMRVLGVYRPEAGGHLVDVAVGGGFAYVVNAAKAGASVEVIGISDPSSPHRLGTVAIPRAIACALAGNLLYVPGMRVGGEPPPMTIVDVANPAKPVVAATVGGLSFSSCYQAQVEGGRLYYTDSLRGINVADLSDPLAPKLIGRFIGSTEVNCTYTDFEIRDGRLYGQRYSMLDVWLLNPAPGASGGTGTP